MFARKARLAWLLLLLSSASPLAGCARAQPVVPAARRADRFGGELDASLRAEQLEGGKAALDAAFALVNAGMSSGEAGLSATLAGLDALVWRESMGLSRVASLHALAFRVPGGFEQVESKLSAALAMGVGHPLARAYAAQALLDVARYQGDVQKASASRARTGVVQTATAVGPLSWSSLGDIERPLAVEASPSLAASYAGVGPFNESVKPVEISADDGVLDVSQAGSMPGVYAVVADVVTERAERLHFSLQSSSAAVLSVGGEVVLTRPYALGGQPVVRMGSVEVPKGRTRVVVRLGNLDDGTRLSLLVVGEDGGPRQTMAPKPGEVAEGKGRAPQAIALESDASVAPLVTAAGLLCLGEVRAARRLIEASPREGPEGALLSARVLERSNDVPEVKRIERTRAAYAKVLSAWSTSYEAIIGSAIYAAARKGPGEGRVETLRDLEKLRGESKGKGDPLVRAFEAATAHEIGLRDVAEAGFEAVKAELGGTPFVVQLDARIHPRVGADAEAFVCDAPMVDRQSLACLTQRGRRGDGKGVHAEIKRLRELRGSPRALLPTELSQRINDNDLEGATAVYDSMLPAERQVAFLSLLALSKPDDARSRIARGDLLATSQGPSLMGGLHRLLGDDHVEKMAAAAQRAIAEERGKSDAQAATLVVLHDERYEIDGRGLLRGLVHDVRRVSGTTDVEQGVSGASFFVVGRDFRKVVRRRIHKSDGRILEPDRANMAAQGNADLSQLEPGDYVEQIIEGFALPDRLGHLVIDTADLLPERTSVRRATIELKHPAKVAFSRWAHPLLGKPIESTAGDAKVTRFELRDVPPRRLEEGVPRMDRDVAVSFGTYNWKDIGRALGEQAKGLVDRDPMVAKWAREVAGEGASPSRATVERVVQAVGKAVRVSQGGFFTDLSAVMGAGSQTITARHVLELGQGSRTLLAYRALSELGVDVEVVAAEREPFSSSATFPARPGRFDKPLLIARVDGGEVWLDLDVAGPPLPAGKVSPDLRGRLALRANGDMVPVQGASGDAARDDVEIALKVDDRGDAQGSVTVVLRGRPAQGLSDALERVVGTDRREMLRAVVLGWVPWASVNEVSLSSAEGSWEVSLKAQVSIPAFAQGEGKTWVLPGVEPLHAVFPRAHVSTLSATYASKSGRQSALAIDSAQAYRVKRRIELPAGVKPVGVLPQVSVKHEHLEATRASKVTGSVIEEDFALQVLSGTIAVEAYDKFAQQAKRVDDGFMSGMRVGK